MLDCYNELLFIKLKLSVISKIGYNSKRMLAYSWTYEANCKLDRISKRENVPSLCTKYLLTSRGVIL